MVTLDLEFYGVGVRVESASQDVVDAVRLDFSYFSAATPSAAPALRITHEAAAPDYDGLPELTCSLATPRNICFTDGDLTYIDYFGKALNIYDKRRNHCRIVTGDLSLAHEIAYLTILSRVSERLERKRLHRVHALGLEHGGRGILVMLPSGGGKSTLALSVLRNPDTGIRLIAEDSPLLARRGQLWPFPLRIGVHPQSLPADIDPSFTRVDRRIEFDPKISIDIRYFKDRLCRAPVPASIVLLGVRSTGTESRIVPASRTAALKHFLMNSVIGVGLYQGLEFIMQQSLRESLRHAGQLLSRASNNVGLFRRARVYSFVIGRDRAKNFAALRAFLESAP
jgi:hypothetical protein